MSELRAGRTGTASGVPFNWLVYGQPNGQVEFVKLPPIPSGKRPALQAQRRASSERSARRHGAWLSADQSEEADAMDSVQNAEPSSASNAPAGTAGASEARRARMNKLAEPKHGRRLLEKEGAMPGMHKPHRPDERSPSHPGSTHRAGSEPPDTGPSRLPPAKVAEHLPPSGRSEDRYSELALPERNPPLNGKAKARVRSNLKEAARVDDLGVAQVESMLGRYDASGAGMLTDELVRRVVRRGFKVPGTEVTDGEISSLCATLDPDGTGQVAIRQLVEFMCAKPKQHRPVRPTRRRETPVKADASHAHASQVAAQQVQHMQQLQPMQRPPEARPCNNTVGIMVSAPDARTLSSDGDRDGIVDELMFARPDDLAAHQQSVLSAQAGAAAAVQEWLTLGGAIVQQQQHQQALLGLVWQQQQQQQQQQQAQAQALQLQGMMFEGPLMQQQQQQQQQQEWPHHQHGEDPLKKDWSSVAAPEVVAALPPSQREVATGQETLQEAVPEPTSQREAPEETGQRLEQEVAAAAAAEQSFSFCSPDAMRLEAKHKSEEPRERAADEFSEFEEDASMRFETPRKEKAAIREEVVDEVEEEDEHEEDAASPEQPSQPDGAMLQNRDDEAESIATEVDDFPLQNDRDIHDFCNRIAEELQGGCEETGAAGAKRDKDKEEQKEASTSKVGGINLPRGKIGQEDDVESIATEVINTARSSADEVDKPAPLEAAAPTAAAPQQQEEEVNDEYADDLYEDDSFVEESVSSESEEQAASATSPVKQALDAVLPLVQPEVERPKAEESEVPSAQPAASFTMAPPQRASGAPTEGGLPPSARSAALAAESDDEEERLAREEELEEEHRIEELDELLQIMA